MANPKVERFRKIRARQRETGGILGVKKETAPKGMTEVSPGKYSFTYPTGETRIFSRERKRGRIVPKKSVPSVSAPSAPSAPVATTPMVTPKTTGSKAAVVPKVRIAPVRPAHSAGATTNTVKAVTNPPTSDQASNMQQGGKEKDYNLPVLIGLGAAGAALGGAAYLAAKTPTSPKTPSTPTKPKSIKPPVSPTVSATQAEAVAALRPPKGKKTGRGKGRSVKAVIEEVKAPPIKAEPKPKAETKSAAPKLKKPRRRARVTKVTTTEAPPVVPIKSPPRVEEPKVEKPKAAKPRRRARVSKVSKPAAVKDVQPVQTKPTPIPKELKPAAPEKIVQAVSTEKVKDEAKPAVKEQKPAKTPRPRRARVSKVEAKRTPTATATPTFDEKPPVKPVPRPSRRFEDIPKDTPIPPRPNTSKINRAARRRIKLKSREEVAAAKAAAAPAPIRTVADLASFGKSPEARGVESTPLPVRARPASIEKSLSKEQLAKEAAAAKAEYASRDTRGRPGKVRRITVPLDDDTIKVVKTGRGSPAHPAKLPVQNPEVGTALALSKNKERADAARRKAIEAHIKKKGVTKIEGDKDAFKKTVIGPKGQIISQEVVNREEDTTKFIRANTKSGKPTLRKKATSALTSEQAAKLFKGAARVTKKGAKLFGPIALAGAVAEEASAAPRGEKKKAATSAAKDVGITATALAVASKAAPVLGQVISKVALPVSAAVGGYSIAKAAKEGYGAYQAYKDMKANEKAMQERYGTMERATRTRKSKKPSTASLIK